MLVDRNMELERHVKRQRVEEGDEVGVEEGKVEVEVERLVRDSPHTPTDAYQYLLTLVRHGSEVTNYTRWWVVAISGSTSMDYEITVENVGTGQALTLRDPLCSTPRRYFTGEPGAPLRLCLCLETVEVAAAEVLTVMPSKCLFELYVNPATLAFYIKNGIPVREEFMLISEFKRSTSIHYLNFNGSSCDVFAAAPTSYFNPHLPSNWKIPLFPSQLASLEWMMNFENRVRRNAVIVESGETLKFGDSGYCICPNSAIITRNECARNNKFQARAGILANATGTGKTALAIALVAATTQSEEWTDVESGWYSSAAGMTTRRSRCTLIIVPINLPQQWFTEFQKFYPGCTILKLTNKREHEAVTYADLQHADCVLTTMSFLCGTYYKRVLSNQLSSYKPGSFEFRYHARKTVNHPNWKDTYCPVLQLMWWRRIIYDEAHELVYGDFSRVRLMDWTVYELHANVVWAFTGTPSMASNDCREFYSRLMLGGHQYRPSSSVTINNLMTQCYHRNQVVEQQPPVHVHEYRVSLTSQELLLINTSSQVPHTVVQIATHFSVLDPQFAREADATVQIRLLSMTDIQKLVQHGREAHIKKLEAGIIAVRSRIGSANAGAVVAEAQLVANPAVQTIVRQVAQIRSGLQTLTTILATSEKELDAARREHDFFNRQLRLGTDSDADKQQDSASTECPICLTAKTVVITRCGHWFCRECAQQMVKTQQKCAMCKYKLTLGDVLELNMVGDAEEQEVAVVAGAGAAGEDETEYGSKLTRIIAKIREIAATGEKIILFVQWTRLMRSVKAVLRASGIRLGSMDGNINTRTAATERLRSGEIDVLLVSLENGASGLTLTEANHVMFAHALVSSTQESRLATYVQALGRVHRIGQTRDVHVHWFIAEGTLEAQLFDAFRQ